MQIAENSVVSIRYIMKNSHGEIVENTMNSEPVNYLHGSAGILPLLQSQLEGLKPGDKKTVHLKTGAGFAGEDFTFELMIDDVRAALPEEILPGYPVKINESKCEVDCNCYDK